MLKLGKTAKMFLVIGILLVLIVSLMMAYSQQAQEQSQLNEMLSSSKLALAKYSPEELASQQEELESQLTEAESALADVKARLRQPIESIDITEVIYGVAEANKVEIIDISSPGLTTEELREITTSVLPLVIKAEGEIPDLINFVRNLSKKFPTGVVTPVQIEVPQATEEEEEEEEEPAEPSVQIGLSVYSYEGD